MTDLQRRRGGGSLGIVTSGLLATLCLACSAPPPPDGLVLVLVDALRADHLGCYGYARPTSPHIDELAADGTRFANAVSSTPWTLPSMGTLMTGLYPSVHGANLATRDLTKWMVHDPSFQPTTALDESRTTLAEVLHAEGFATAAFINGSYPGRAFGLAQGYDRFADNESPGIRLNLEALLAWLDRERPRRFFTYLHATEVHTPYTPPPPNPLYPADSPDPRKRYVAQVLDEERARYREFEFDPQYEGQIDGSWASITPVRQSARSTALRDRQHLIALYDRGIAYTDYWIGHLVEGLKARGLYERTVLVVTADHGEELFDHGGFEHTKTYYEELMHVPLVVRVPGEGRGRVIEEQVGLIDVFPTLLDVLGIRDGPRVQGRSVRPLLRGRWMPERPVFGEASQVLGRKALRTNRWKYITQPHARPELYDLRKDPHEKVNLCATDVRPCGPFRQQLLDWQAKMRAAAAALGLPPPKVPEVDDETRARLRALGYL